nr:hypothetical protein [Bryobacter sp.]
MLAAGYVLAQRAEPYLREQIVSFLEKRFQCRAELKDFRVTIPPRAVLAGLFRRRGAEKMNIQLRGLVLRFSDDLPPLIE